MFVSLWKRLDDVWLVTNRAAKLLLICTFFVIALTPMFIGYMPSSPSALTEMIWGAVGVCGALALFIIWVAMWRYWARVDNSNAWVKRLWFIILLAGFWYGSVLYYYCVYLPQRRRRGLNI